MVKRKFIDSAVNTAYTLLNEVKPQDFIITERFRYEELCEDVRKDLRLPYGDEATAIKIYTESDEWFDEKGVPFPDPKEDPIGGTFSGGTFNNGGVFKGGTLLRWSVKRWLGGEEDSGEEEEKTKLNEKRKNENK